MKVSVLMAVYNGGQTLRETIESILAQTHHDLEILAVDDGSTDDSAQIIKSFVDPRIKYFKIKNSGSPAAPRNYAIKNSSGEIFALCDQDDIWYPEKIEKQLKKYEQSKFRDKIGIIHCRADYIDGVGQKIGESEKTKEGFIEQESAFREMVFGNYIRACSAIIPKDIIKEIGNFNEKLHGNDEYDLWIRITEKYGTLGLSEKLCAWRRFDQSYSINVSRVYEENEKIFAQFEKKQGYNSELIKIGHGKNINRVMVAAILEGNKERAIKFAQKAKGYPVSLKGKIVSFFALTSYTTTEKVLKFYQKKGKISL